jgi:ATP synthase F1 complex assembly factor 1
MTGRPLGLGNSGSSKTPSLSLLAAGQGIGRGGAGTNAGPTTKVQFRFMTTPAAQQRIDDTVLAKYREKLEEKAKREGKDVETLVAEFKQAQVTARENKAKAAATIAVAANTKAPNLKSNSSTTSGPAVDTVGVEEASENEPTIDLSKAPPGLRTLSTYVDVDKLVELPADEISKIWTVRHSADPSSLAATIPGSTWLKTAEIARKHPLFILPTIHNLSPETSPQADDPSSSTPQTGAELHLVQWSFPTSKVATAIFTRLAEYQARKEWARPHTTLTFHQDLLSTPAGIVLMNGTAEATDGANMTPEQAQWLVICLQRFYSTPTEERIKLLELFSKGDETFRPEDVVISCEKLD